MSVPQCHMGICILEGENGFPGFLESGLLTRGTSRIPAIRRSLLPATLTDKRGKHGMCFWHCTERSVLGESEVAT